MTTRRLASAALVSLLSITLASCDGKAGGADTATVPTATAAAVKPSLPPILNTATATFHPVAEMAPIVEGAKITSIAADGHKVSPSVTLSGYQVGATLPTDQVDHIVLRYQVGQSADSIVVGMLAEDGSHWLTSANVGAGAPPSGELTTAVTEKSVRFVVESKSGAKPFVLEKLEWAAFCVKPSSTPDVAPVAEQCYPKLQPIITTEGARFVAPPALTPWTSAAKVESGPDGTITITPSGTSAGYQASVDVAKGNTVALAVRYELDGSGAVGNIGILRGDASAWVATAAFGPEHPKSGEITGLFEGASLKLVVESAAGAPPIKFRKLELASLCETRPAQGPNAATVSGCS